MSIVYVALDNITEVSEIRDLIEKSGPALLRAVNDAGRWAHAEAHKRVGKDLNWPAGYLNDKTLSFRPARGHNKHDGAIVRARTRPTSLNRFALTGQSMRERHGVRVEVTKGSPKTIQKAFFMRLNNRNVGMAIREHSYREMPGVRAGKYVWNGLVFLYGPSVDQVFRTHRDGPDGIAAQALDRLEESFERLLGGDS